MPPWAGSHARRIVDAFPRFASFALFAVLPLILMVVSLRAHGLGWDFRAFYLGARAYLSGLSPYPAHSLAGLASKQNFVYPAPVAALFAPLALLPYALALTLWLVGSVAAIGLALRLLGVRDWRCFGALFLTYPAREAVRLGTLMPLLMLLLALLWRYRERATRAACLAAIVALAKVFLFPVLVWLAATRRFRAAALGTALAAGMCVLAWLPLELSSAISYPALLHALASFEDTFSYSLTSFGLGVGLPTNAASALAWTVGGAVLATAVAVGRRAECLAFRLALAGSFLLSPIVWGHYFLLLIVPLALRRRRLSAAWFAAIGIRSDTLALPAAPLWVALALLVMLLQLDLLPSVTRRTLAWLAPHVRTTAGVAFGVGILAAGTAAAEAGYARNATLRPLANRSPASGAASIRIDLPAMRLCWRIWTHALPPGAAGVTIADRSLSQRALRLPVDLEPDGQSRGCNRLFRTDYGIALSLIDQPSRYRMIVAAHDAPPVTGTLQGQ